MSNNTRPTQEEQVKSATRAYLMRLNDYRGTMCRFAVYLLRDGALEILWPSDSNEKKSKELFPCQVHSKNRKYPAFHFALNGCGYSKEGEIADTLRRVNPALTVESLGGCHPSAH